jgi:alpha-glucuronidase
LIDSERFAHVRDLLAQQERDACVWRDACILYFQQFSKQPIPPGVDPAAHDLAYYESIQLHYFPGTPSGK